MGLPKTGTTATVAALQKVGLGVMQNKGDAIYHSKIKHCDAIANTMEDSYDLLDKRHPSAKWIITYSENSTAWLESVRLHLRALWGPSEIDVWGQYFGCYFGLPLSFNGDPNRVFRASPLGFFLSNDTSTLLEAYHLYYARLFTYMRGRDYALVDVRATQYHRVHMIDPRIATPFDVKNKMVNPNHYVQGNPSSRSCAYEHNWLKLRAENEARACKRRPAFSSI